MSALARAFLVGLMLAASLPAQAARDSLVIGITQFPSTLHPHINSMLAKSYVLNTTMRPLTTYDQDWTLVCMLCVDLPTIENGMAEREELENGGTGVAVTYRIHPDATWGDGTPVTSGDAVFTWKAGRNEMAGFAGLEGFRRTLSVEVIDDKTFVMHGDRLTYTYNAANGFYLLPAHLEAEPFAEPAEYRHRTLYDTDPTNPGLYFGPYRVRDVVSGSHVVLEPNPTWYGPPPAFKRVVIRVIENTAALEANLLSGEIDYVAGELGFSVDQAMSFERRKIAGFVVDYKPGLIYEHLDVNLDNPILAEPTVRLALIISIDRQLLSEQLFGGHQPVAHSNINPLDRIYSETVPNHAYDRERAAALLDEAGWTSGGDGVRRNAAGEKLTFPLMTTAGNKSRELVQQVLQSQWRKVGIEAVIRNEPARVFFGETMTKRANPGLSMYAWLSAPEAVPLSTLRSDQIPQESNGWSGQNFPGYRSDRMNELIDAIEIELDPAARLPMWAELQALYATDLPALPLYFRAEPYVRPIWLEGLRPTGHLVTTTMWIEEWRAEGE
ncbi:MAG: peptide ABC transporter substrate-binding protein [Alphaproteobacteria bacterium]|nr:peptide ABC transporter substrate-binding protein [Alphaproteobacteria bacterium]